MSRDKTLLHPDMRRKLEEFEYRCKQAGLNVLITETYRTVDEQNALYAQGRTKPGNVVTNCKGTDYQSPHQWGGAFDFCKNVKGHEYDDPAFFAEVGKVAKSMGLFWGGDFKSFVDRPHIEWTGIIVNNSTNTLKAKYGTPEKYRATWGAYTPWEPPKVAEPITPTMTGKQALDYLVSKGRINAPEYWADKLKSVSFLDSLLIGWAKDVP